MLLLIPDSTGLLYGAVAPGSDTSQACRLSLRLEYSNEVEAAYTVAAVDRNSRVLENVEDKVRSQRSRQQLSSAPSQVPYAHCPTYTASRTSA